MAAEIFAPDLIGGSGRWLHEVAKCLIDRGNKITLVLRRSRPDLPAQETIDGIRVFRYGKSRKKSWTNGLLYFFQGRELIKSLWKQEYFDICHIQQPFSGLITLQGSPSNKLMIYTYHSPWHQEYLVDQAKGNSPGINPGYWIRLAIERSVVSHCQKIILLSNYSLGLVDRYHNLKERCIQIPGGIDIIRFSPAISKNQVKQELGLPASSFLLFTVRNLRQRMGLFQLLEAITLLKKSIPGIFLIIAGKGPLQHDLEDKISDSQLQPNVSLVGQVAEEKLPLYYQAADIFVLPTQQLEGFGLVTMESLASGTPVVATPVSANLEVVGGLDKKFLSDGIEGKDIAQAVSKIYKELMDGHIDFKACRKYAEKFSWENIAEQVENCYKDLTTSHT